MARARKHNSPVETAERTIEPPAVSAWTQVAPPLDDASQVEWLAYLKLLERVKALKLARDDFLTFCRLMMPDPQFPDDPSKSAYQVTPHIRVLAHALHKIDRGELLRLIITMPPRMGKSQTVSKFFVAWELGRKPGESAALATYSDDFAGDFGRDVRAILKSPQFRAIFPEFELRSGSAAASRMTSAQGGTAVFVGRGGALTGRGFSSVGIIDDLLKDAEEAESTAIRNKCWEWFTRVFMTRQMHGGVPVVIVMTRWHEDDIVGRLIDPKNPVYEEEEAKHWKIINLAFFAEENDPLKRKPNEVLWPERFSAEFGEAQRRLNPRAFAALYQGRPSLADGIYFRKSWFQYWEPGQRPKDEELRIYAASDHAVSTEEENDKTCMLIAGVSEDAQIYLLDCLWTQLDAQQQVEKMLDLMDKWKPQLWWAEAGHITKSIGPFLRKRKLERGIVGVIDEVQPTKDKIARARSIQGMFADGRVWFPRRAWWRLDAEDELLKFSPASSRDDFVDAVSWIGIKVQQMFALRKPINKPAGGNENSWGEFKRRAAAEEHAAAAQEVCGGW